MSISKNTTDWVTVEQLAKEMGTSVSYIRNQIKTNKLRCFKSGRVTRIRTDWVSDWIVSGTSYGESL